MGIKYHVDETFFDTWTRSMSYMLGYIYADGCIGNYPYMRAQYLGIDSTDLQTIITFKNWLSSSHKIKTRVSQWDNGKRIYSLRIGSHKIYDSLVRLGVTPRKSLTMIFPDIPREYFSDFVRGYFDGDGCVHLEKIIRKNGKMRPRKLNIIFTSGSDQFLIRLSELLHEYFGLILQRTLRSWTAFQLRYGTKDSMRLFAELYKSCKKGDYLERKYEIFKEFFKLHKRPCGEDS